MADQVHRREKQRRRELLQWREDWHAVLSLDPAEALENLPSGPVSSPSADRESRLANRAAMQAAREASTLVGAQVRQDMWEERTLVLSLRLPALWRGTTVTESLALVGFLSYLSDAGVPGICGRGGH